jgi:hypothetical protein
MTPDQMTAFLATNPPQLNGKVILGSSTIAPPKGLAITFYILADMTTVCQDSAGNPATWPE